MQHGTGGRCSRKHLWTSKKHRKKDHAALTKFTDANKEINDSLMRLHMVGSCVVQQEDDGIWKTISFISRAMTPTEKRCVQIEKVALAITWTCERSGTTSSSKPSVLRQTINYCWCRSLSRTHWIKLPVFNEWEWDWWGPSSRSSSTGQGRNSIWLMLCPHYKAKSRQLSRPLVGKKWKHT